MDGMQSHEAGSSLISITVLSVTPMRAGKLFALASVEIDIEGVRIEVRGIRAMRVPTSETKVELPTFRDAAGQSRAAIVLLDEVHGPIGDAVIETLIERGLAKRWFTCRSQIDHRRPTPFGTYSARKIKLISEAWFA
jgi:hypothetical protein